MMKKCCIGLIALLLLSCHNNNSNQAAVPSNQTDSLRTDTAFFPVTSFIKGQMLEFDSMPVTPLHLTIINEKTDSEWVKREQLKSRLADFLKPEIDEKNLFPYFKETKFNDQTINAVTFSYDPIGGLPDTLTLRSWDVYVNPTTGTVTRIYIVKEIKNNNQDITQQLTWETGKSATLINIINKPDGSSEILRQEKYTWNFNQ